MPGEESAVGNPSAAMFLPEGESLDEVPVDIDFTSPEFTLVIHTQAVESSSLSTRVAGPTVYSRNLQFQLSPPGSGG